jgi:hypothetical protein
MLATMIARHKSECRHNNPPSSSNAAAAAADDLTDFEGPTMAEKSKKYVPVHLSGVCPYCEHKFSDLLGHIRHNHNMEKGNTDCALCSESFKRDGI